MSYELFKTFTYGLVDYLARHSSNAVIIEAALNELAGKIVGATGGLAVLAGMREIFDRPGLIGRDSYDFDAVELEGPGYNFTVAPGAFWYAGLFYNKTTESTLSMEDQPTGTYYINLDAAGNPVLATVPGTTTTRQFEWDAATHIISAKVLYEGVSILFDGDDYAAMLVSPLFGTTYTRVADRLNEIDSLIATMGAYYAQDHTSGLDFYYTAGKVRDADSQIHETEEGHVTCEASETNYIEVAPDTGVVSVNHAGFTSGSIPLFTAVASESAVTTVTDMRTWACVGGGEGGGGHTQGTDLGTTSTQFEIDTDAAGNPTGRAGLRVNNGADPYADLKYNRDTNKWEYSEDGGATWHNFGEVVAEEGQELNKFVPFDDPPMVLEEIGRSSSEDFETLDLSAYTAAAPLGAVAVAIRLAFWDDTEDPASYAIFRKAGIGEIPLGNYFLASTDHNMRSLIIPLSVAQDLEYYIQVSEGAGNLLVFLLGYFETIIAQGPEGPPGPQGEQGEPGSSIDLNFSSSGNEVAAGATQDFNLAGFLNRGLAHYVKVEETGGLMTGTYDLHLYSRSTMLAADLLYKLEDVDPASDFEDWLPFWAQDLDVEQKLHLRIINNDLSNAGTFTITINAEAFA